jgi:hypothetical protein
MNSNIWQMDTNANKKMIKEMKMEMKNDATPDLIEKLQQSSSSLTYCGVKKEMSKPLSQSECTNTILDPTSYSLRNSDPLRVSTTTT